MGGDFFCKFVAANTKAMTPKELYLAPACDVVALNSESAVLQASQFTKEDYNPVLW